MSVKYNSWGSSSIRECIDYYALLEGDLSIYMLIKSKSAAIWNHPSHPLEFWL